MTTEQSKETERIALLEETERIALLIEKGYIESSYFPQERAKLTENEEKELKKHMENEELKKHILIAELSYLRDQKFNEFESCLSAITVFLDLPTGLFYQINQQLSKLHSYSKKSDVDVDIGLGAMCIAQHHIRSLLKKPKSDSDSGDVSPFDETTNNLINYLEEIKKLFLTTIAIVELEDKMKNKLSQVEKLTLFGRSFVKYINSKTVEYIIKVNDAIIDLIEKNI